MNEFWTGICVSVAWLIALAWVLRVAGMIRGLPQVADLSLPERNVPLADAPTLAVLVPACNEAEHIEATLAALLMSDYPRLEIVAINDRSTDATGALMEQVAAGDKSGRLRVLHIHELPDGWLGKTHALAVGTDATTSEFILCTDADVLHSPSVFRRAMAYVVAEQADHLVVLPTTQMKSRGEGIILGFFVLYMHWATRMWRVSDVRSRRDPVGVGAFNLLRRAAWEELGGWAPQRLCVVEDITLGLRVRAAGMQQRVAHAPGMVLVHWASGMLGIVRVMTKNLFAAMNFHLLIALAFSVWITMFWVLPVAGVFWMPTTLPSVLVLLSIFAAYRTLAPLTWIPEGYALGAPVGAVAFLYALLRSIVVVLWRRGVVWRGTFYPLSELRRHNSPFQWERAAAEQRRESRLLARGLKRRG